MPLAILDFPHWVEVQGGAEIEKRLQLPMRFVAAFLAFSTSAASAETVDVKYRGLVDLAPFVCHGVTRSSFIRRVCYDEKERYMIVLLDKTYYHYCEIDRAVVSGLEGAMSMGRFFNEHIKGTGSDGRFDCRTHRVPSYK